MNETQLNAHRDDFERAYTKNIGHTDGFVLSCRRGDTYTNYEITVAWQAYQWALADVAKAAPVGDAQPVAWLPKGWFDVHRTQQWMNVSLRQLHSQQDWEPLYRGPVAAQPVEQKIRYCETCEQKVTGPCNSADCTTPDAAAQPVEVQRVPLDNIRAILYQCDRGNVSLSWLIDALRGIIERSAGEAETGRVPLSKEEIFKAVKTAGLVANQASIVGARAIEKAHDIGIKPAGTGLGQES